MTTSMYCLYVGIDYTYIDVNALAQGIKSFWPHKFGFKPLLGLEPMAPIRPQLLVSHANHSATETSMYACMYVCITSSCLGYTNRMLHKVAWLQGCLDQYSIYYISTLMLPRNKSKHNTHNTHSNMYSGNCLKRLTSANNKELTILLVDITHQTNHTISS